MLRYANLNDTVYYWVALNTTAGSGGDGASQVFDVRLGGASSSTAPVYSGSATVLSDAAYPDGCLEIAIPATTGNGFAASNQYGIFCAAAISGVNPTGFVGGLNLSPVISSLSAAGLATDAVTEIVDAVWNALLIGSTYNLPTSAGRRLRELAGSIVISGTAQGGAAASITLAAGASSTDGTYDPAIVRLVSGTGSGQARLIIDYVGSTRVASVNRDWRVAPDNTTGYEIIAAANLLSTNEGLATGGGANTITLNSTASAVNDTYNGQLIELVTGTGQDQSRIISAYNGTTKVVTVAEAWVTQPVAGTGYMINPIGRSYVSTIGTQALAQFFTVDTGETFASAVPGSVVYETATNSAVNIQDIVDGVWDEPMASHVTVGTTGLTLSNRLAAASYTAPDNAGIAAISVVADRLDTMIVLDGAVYQFTANALELAPAGSPTDFVNALFAAETETGETYLEAYRLMRAESAGKVFVTDGGTNVVFRDANDTLDRIDATVDSSGQRTAVTVNGA